MGGGELFDFLAMRSAGWAGTSISTRGGLQPNIDKPNLRACRLAAEISGTLVVPEETAKKCGVWTPGAPRPDAVVLGD